MRRIIGITAAVAAVAVLATIAPRVEQLRGNDDGRDEEVRAGVRIVTGRATSSIATAFPIAADASSANRLMARAPPSIRRAYAAMIATPPAPMLETALRQQLAFIGAATGTSPAIVCRAARCALVGDIPTGARRGKTESLLRGAAMDDTLATWQLVRGDWTIVPATADTPAGFVLFIDHRN